MLINKPPWHGKYAVLLCFVEHMHEVGTCVFFDLPIPFPVWFAADIGGNILFDTEEEAKEVAFYYSIEVFNHLARSRLAATVLGPKRV